jgi:hypothetical protein
LTANAGSPRGCYAGFNVSILEVPAVQDRPQALFAAKPGWSTGRCDGAAAFDAHSDLSTLSGFEDAREAVAVTQAARRPAAGAGLYCRG